MESPNLEKTLEELEKDFWEQPDNPTGLVATCHLLRKKPLGNLTAGDLRILIGQDIGVAFVLPLALNILDETPLIKASYYEGDLLFSTIKCQYLQSKEMENTRVHLAKLCEQTLDEKRTIIKKEVHEDVWSHYEGQSPEDFGLSREILNKQEQDALELALNELRENPWSDLSKFAQKNEHL